MKKNDNLRIWYILFFVVFMIVEVCIALFVHDSFVRPYIGDVLVVVVVYCFARIFVPERSRLLPLYVFLFAAGVELLQYFNIVTLFGLEKNEFLRVLIGSTFDVKDIICYTVGTVMLGVYELVKWRKNVE